MIPYPTTSAMADANRAIYKAPEHAKAIDIDPNYAAILRESEVADKDAEPETE